MEIQRAVWLSAGIAAITGAGLAALVYAGYVSLVRRTGSRGASAVMAVLGLAAAYVVSGTVLFLILHMQLDPPAPPGVFRSIRYVLPGILPRLVPLLAIVLTWFLLLGRARFGRH